MNLSDDPPSYSPAGQAAALQAETGTQQVSRRADLAGNSSGSRTTGRKTELPFVSFNRLELDRVLRIYGRGIAAGLWRDYSIDHRRDMAVFAIYRRSGEYPLYRVEKRPRLEKRQGAYSIVTQSGLILKRGHDLKQVLRVIEHKLWRVVSDET